MPGGGVKRGETFQQAAVRELQEECSVRTDAPRLLQVFFSSRAGKHDHIALYLVDRFTEESHKRDPEIAEMRFFPIDSLPKDVTPATRRRIEEYIAGGKYDSIW
jgi:ADP-ribose pyrophosphatase YjhB (NUDIX family)